MTPSADTPGYANRAEAIAPVSVRHPRATIVATMLASSLAFIDGSVTNVALPAIGKDLNGSAADLTWTINAYLLPLSALLLLGGAAGDHFGRRRTLIFGVFLFLIASVGCALAPNLGLLLLSRAAQGLGAAILMPNSLGILGSSFDGEARGRAVGTWAAAGAIASAVGPPIGGWLIDAFSWRAIFFVNVPVAIAAIVIMWRYVDESPATQQSLDWAGGLLATGMLGALTWSLTIWSSHQGSHSAIAFGLGVGAVLVIAFLFVEHRRGALAMMPLALFASRPFVGLTLLTLLLYGALGGFVVLLPYLLIVGGGYSPTHAGFALLPLSIVMGTMSGEAGRFAERVGPRLLLTVGPIVTGVGFALLTRVNPQTSYWISMLPGVIVLAAGMTATVAPLTTAVLAAVDSRHVGTASGFNSAVARTGGLIATALSGAVMSQRGTDLVDAFHHAAWIACALAALAGLCSLTLLKRGS